jgi:hypothetical protein
MEATDTAIWASARLKKLMSEAMLDTEALKEGANVAFGLGRLHTRKSGFGRLPPDADDTGRRRRVSTHCDQSRMAAFLLHNRRLSPVHWLGLAAPAALAMRDDSGHGPS